MLEPFSARTEAQKCWQVIDEQQLTAAFPETVRETPVLCQLEVFDEWALGVFKKVFPLPDCGDLHIGTAIKNPDILLFLLGDLEVSQSEKERIHKLKLETNAMAFGMIIFTDAYFKVGPNDQWSYSSTIKKLKNHARHGVLPVKHADLVAHPHEFAPFFDKMALMAKMKKGIAVFDEWGTGLSKVSDTITTAPDRPDSPVFNLLNRLFLNRIDYFKDAASTIQHSILRSTLDKTKLRFEAETDQIEKNALVQMHQLGNIPEGLPKFGVEVLATAKNFRDFMEELADYPELADNFPKRLEKLELLLELATNLSVVGTFSSGKTTLVNYFFGTRLKTSYEHNTAVLTALEYLPPEKKPFVSFSYDDNYAFEVFGTDWNHPSIAVTANRNGTVQEIVTSSNGEKTLILHDRSFGELVPIVIGNKILSEKLEKAFRNGKKGSADVKINEPLTMGMSRQAFSKHNSSRKVNCLGKSELNELIAQIRKGSFSSTQLTLDATDDTSESIQDRGEILDILREICQLAPEHTYDSIDVTTEVNTTQNLFQKFWKAELKLHLSENHHLPRQLDMEAALEIGPGENLPLLEKPVIFLFARKVHLKTQAPVLQLANVIDTPGLGSVSTWHDLISERHLRETTGVIVIMIKVDMRLERREFWDLLHLLQQIFRIQKRSTDHVFFIANCKSGIWGDNKDKSLDNKLAELKKHIANFGFQHHQLYAVNLKPGEESFSLEHYPDLNRFRIDLENKMKEVGSGQKLDQLHSELERLVSAQIANDRQQLDLFSKATSLHSRIEKDYLDQRQTIQKIASDEHSRKKDVQKLDEAYSLCIGILNRVTSGADLDKAKQSLVDIGSIVNSHFKKPVYFSHLQACNRTITDAGHGLTYRVNISVTSRNFDNCGEVSSTGFEKRIDELRRSWPNQLERGWKWLWGERQSSLDSHRASISSFLKADLDRIRKEFNQEADKGEAWFKENKKNALHSIDQQIHGLANQNSTEKASLENRIHLLEHTVIPDLEKLKQQVNYLLTP